LEDSAPLAAPFAGSGGSATDTTVDLFDSGASSHMTSNRSALTEYRSIEPIPICAANQTLFQGVGCGTLTVEVPNGENKMHLRIRDVLYAPKLGASLISIGKLTEQGFTAQFKGSQLIIGSQNGQQQGVIEKRNGLYSVSRKIDSAAAVTTPHTTISLYDLHCRLGHLNYGAIRRMIANKSLPGFTILPLTEVECIPCNLAKMKTKEIRKTRSLPKAERFGDVVSMDIWGPARTETIHHHRYTFTLIDNATRWLWMPTMRLKSEALSKLVGIESREELQHGVKFKRYYSDRDCYNASLSLSSTLEL